jgi:hypothetical protein
VFALIIYFPSGLYFLSDDLIHIPLSDKGELFQRNSLRPVNNIFLSLDIFLWGKNVSGFHSMSLFIHLLCALCLFRVTDTLLMRYQATDRLKARQACFLATGLFLIYAFHSETVLWILGSGAALCTLFFLLSIGCYLLKEKSFYFFLASLIFFQIGLFTYEAIWIAPLFIICFYVLDIMLLKKSWKKEFIWMFVYVISFVVYLAVRFNITGNVANEYELGKNTNISIAGLFLNYNTLLARSFIPSLQSSILFLIFYGAVIVLLLFYILKKRKTVNKTFSISLASLFLVSLLPYIFLGIDTHTRESERFLYLPSTVLCILIAYAIIKANLSYKLLTSVCIFIFLYNAIFIYLNRRDYNVASVISKSIYYHANIATQSSEIVTVNNLPEQFNGVPIFREGFKEGLVWLFSTDTSKIKISNTPMLISNAAYLKNFLKEDFIMNIKVKKDTDKDASLTFEPDTNYFTFLPDSLAISKYYRTIDLK